MKRMVILFSVALVVTASIPVAPTTWIVTYDPEDDVDRIGQVVLQAASGDTVLVGSGTYYEHIPVEGKSLTFLSIDGPEATILDGSMEIEDREGSIFYTATGVVADLKVEGLTLRGGQGSHARTGDFGGGAIAWWNESGSGSLVVENCHLLDNTTAELGLYLTAGGAIFTSFTGEVRIASSTFAGNTAEDWGGSIACLHAETCEVTSCSFEVMRTALSGGAAIFTLGLHTLTIEGCEFTSSDTGEPWLYGVECAALHSRVVGNRFVDHSSSLATKIRFRFGDIVEQPLIRLEFSGNVLYRNMTAGARDEENLRIVLGEADVEISGNTFAGCDIAEHVSGGTGLQFHRNIVYMGRAEIPHTPGGSIRCNNFWPDSVEVGWGGMELQDNISADPLFCDEETGDLRLAFQSPCAPDNAPEGCGRIGALPAECDLTPVERTSWGAIKAMYK